MPDWFTCEAVQCRLGTLGVVLWPVFFEGSEPPEYISDEDIYRLELRIFPNPNLTGEVYDYVRNEPENRWYLADNATND